MNTTRAPRGFTLLEMMVVMVLMGLLTTLALPAMQRWHDGVQVRSQVAAVVEALQAAAFAAPTSRKLLVMDGASFVAAQVAAPNLSGGIASGQVDKSASFEVGQPRDPSLLQLPLPNGWKAERVSRADFLPNGLCRPGHATLRTERGAPVFIEVQGPLCAVITSNTEPGK